MDKRRSFAPIIAAVLLLLPVLYMGSYLALVMPGNYDKAELDPGSPDARQYVKGYRFEGDDKSQLTGVAPFVFWPLEQIDRKVRPQRWGEGE